MTVRRASSIGRIACTLLALATGLATARAERPPNVVIVFCDDLGYGDLSCYGGSTPTPHIDRLAREGTRFTDFHVAQPVCSASRAALLTGCYPNRIGIAGALGPQATHGLAATETTLAELLHDRGYRTAAVGKWHLGHQPEFLPTRHGFDEWLGLPYSNDMWPHHPELRKKAFPPLPLFDGETVVDADVTADDQATLTGRYAARAVDFIERSATGDVPFFLYLAHAMPHVPLFVGGEFRGRSATGTYGDVITEIDASVGSILAALDRTGAADRTLVIVTSDNGPWLSYGDHAGSAGPLREGKGTVFEGGVRVPCVVRLPGVVPADTTSAAPLMTIDLLPTIASLTGEPLPHDDDGHVVVAGNRIDGRDRTAAFRGQFDPTTPPDEPEYGFWYLDNQLQAVRIGHWKLMLPHSARTMAGQQPGRGGRPGTYVPLPVGRELYDLDVDPGEEHDVAAGHPDVVAHLEAFAERLRAELGDSLTKRTGSGVRPAGRSTAAVPLGNGCHAVFVTAAAAAAHLGREDDYVARMSPFDRSARLRTTRDVTTADYLAFVREQARDWDVDDRAAVTAALESLAPALAKLPLPLPATVALVTTSGEEEAHAAYTRGNAIVLPRSVLRGPGLQRLIAHELVHVASRLDPAWRDALYAAIGFHRCPEPVLPATLGDHTIANPDAPFHDHAILVRHDGRPAWAVPLLVADPPRYDDAKGGTFFDFMQLKFLLLDRPADAAADVPGRLDDPPRLVSLEALEGFHDQVGRNTGYIIHPEEIVADNVALLLTAQPDPPSPDVATRIAEILERRAADVR